MHECTINCSAYCAVARARRASGQPAGRRHGRYLETLASYQKFDSSVDADLLVEKFHPAPI